MNVFVKKIIRVIPSLFFSFTVFAQVPPPPELISKNNNELNAKFTNWVTKLQIYENTRGTGGTYALGIGSLGSVQPSSEMYIESVNAAYKQALLGAYVSLANKLSEDGLNVSTDMGVDSRSSRGNAIDIQAKRDCEADAKEAYRISQVNLAKEKENKDSFINLLKNKLKSDEQLAKEEIELETPQVDFIHECRYEGETYSQNSTTTSFITDVLSGAGVYASALHNGQLAVVVKRSPTSSAVASTLLNQTMPNVINSNALGEVSDRIDLEFSRQTEVPQGLVGTRLMKLSNGEWALYAFGASQISVDDSFMSGLSSLQDSQVASTRALAELTRFSEFTINFDSLLKELRDVRETKVVSVNMTTGKTRVSTEKDQLLGRILETSFNSQSTLDLKGAELVAMELKEISNASIYIAAYAWSPSIMALNQGARNTQDDAAERAKNTVAPTDNQETSKSSKIIISDENW